MGMHETIAFMSQSTFFDQDIVDTFLDVVNAFSLEKWSAGVNRYTTPDELQDPLNDGNFLESVAHFAKAIWGTMQTLVETMVQISYSGVKLIWSVLQNIYNFIKFMFYGVFGIQMP